MQVQPRGERLASHRHAQTLDETLLVHAHHGQGRREPAQKTQADDERLQTAADDRERPRRAQIDTELRLGAVEDTGREIRPCTKDGEDREVEGKHRGLAVPRLARAIEAEAHGRGNGEDGKVEYVHNGLQSRPRQAA